MPDTVNTNVVFNGDRKYLVVLTNESDGTGESAVVKVDASSFTPAVDHFVIEEIEYSVQGFNHAKLSFDATTDKDAVILSGSGYMDLRDGGGLADPRSTGYTGDILLTTDGGAAGSMYNIVLKVVKKYD